MGSAAPTMAERPDRLKARVKETAVEVIVAVASSTGSAGSNVTSPQLTPPTAVKMFKPLGRGQYAPGSSSWADARTGHITSTNAAIIRLKSRDPLAGSLLQSC